MRAHYYVFTLLAGPLVNLILAIKMIWKVLKAKNACALLCDFI